MQKLGFFNIDGVEVGEKTENIKAVIARMQEASKGKDTTIGHWEIAGLISGKPMPVYPNGFPKEVIEEFDTKMCIYGHLHTAGGFAKKLDNENYFLVSADYLAFEPKKLV